MSNAEYRNTVTDLFSAIPNFASVVQSATTEFPAEPESLGFRNNAEFLTVQTLAAQKYMDAAEMLAERAAQSDNLVPCEPVAADPMACARTFIRDFAGRAYRRPLTSEELTRYEAQFRDALVSYDFGTATEWFLYTVLQAPSFLYRAEAGQPVSAGALSRPTAHEMASRLSYLFWQSLPDLELLRAAEAGELATKEGISRSARRLLSDPRSSRLFQYFSEWLDLDRLPDMSRDASVYRALPQELPRLMEEETRAFVLSLLRRPNGSFHELLTAPYTYANSTLAEHYGLSGVTSSGFVQADDPSRSGILTQAMITVHDKPYRTSIVRRGLKIRTDLLCQNVPAPPNDVPLNLDALDASLSQRERLEQHRSDPSCAGCHLLLDPVGLVFENFDAVGRYRSVDETGEPIVAEASISGTRDANGSVKSVRELGQLLAHSSEARECYVTQTFRFFFGRELEPADSCTIHQLNEAFSRSNFSLSELLVELTQTDAFLYMRPLEVAP